MLAGIAPCAALAVTGLPAARFVAAQARAGAAAKAARTSSAPNSASSLGVRFP